MNFYCIDYGAEDLEIAKILSEYISLSLDNN